MLSRVNAIENRLIAMGRSVQNINGQEIVLLQTEYQKELAQIAMDEKALVLQKNEMEKHLAVAEASYTLNKNLAESAYLACANGNLEAIQSAFGAGDETWRLFSALFPLNQAIEHHHANIVQFLLEKGVNYRFQTPIHLAPYAMVLPWSFNPNLSSEQQMIHEALKTQILKDFDSFCLNEDLDWFYKALRLMPRTAANEFLNSTISSQNGMTILMLLARDNRLEDLRALDSDFSIDFKKQDLNAKDIFDHALYWGHQAFCEWLLKKSYRILTPLEKACQVGDINTMGSLLKSGTDPVGHQNSPLILAAMYGQAGAISILAFRPGVLLDAENGAPMVVAANNGHFEAVRALRLMGASIHVRDDLALAIAQRKQDQKIVDYFNEVIRLEKAPLLFSGAVGKANTNTTLIKTTDLKV